MRAAAVVSALCLIILPTAAKGEPGHGQVAAFNYTLGKVVDKMQDSLTDAPREAVRDPEMARRFLTNLKALASSAKKVDQPLSRPGDSRLVQAFVTAKRAQFELMSEYMKVALEEALPALKGLLWWGGVLAGVATPTEANLGAGFEYCSPDGMSRDKGRKYVLNMIATYETEPFSRILKRSGCPEAMIGYLMR